MKSTEKTAKILVFSHDPGAIRAVVPVAQEIASGSTAEPVFITHPNVRRSSGDENIPSLHLENFGDIRDLRSCFSSVLKAVEPEAVLTGSSVVRSEEPYCKEQQLVSVANACGIPTVMVLDSWEFCERRFTTDGRLHEKAYLPSKICVLDRPMYDLLRKLGIEEDRLRITHNPSLDCLVESLAETPPAANEIVEGKTNVLFVSQPLAEMRHKRKWPYTQEDLLKALVEGLHRESGRSWNIILWPHPLEQEKKWDLWKDYRKNGVSIGVSDRRGPSVMAYVDLLVTSHSTIAYEAAYYGITTLLLQIGAKQPLPFATAEIGFARSVLTREQLQVCLRELENFPSRAAQLSAKRELTEKGIFFSDGKARHRVVAVLASALAARQEAL